MFNEFITSEENIFSVQQLSICISICISCPLKVLRFNTGILHDSCEVPLTKTLNGVLSIEYSYFMFDFVSHVCLQWFSVWRICNNDLTKINRSVAESCCSTGFSCVFSWLWANQRFFKLQVLIPLICYLISSVSGEVSLNYISRTRLLLNLRKSIYICVYIFFFYSIIYTNMKTNKTKSNKLIKK